MMLEPFYQPMFQSYYDTEQQKLCAFIYYKTEAPGREHLLDACPQDFYRKYYRINSRWVDSDTYEGKNCCCSSFTKYALETLLNSGTLIPVKDKLYWEVLDTLS